MPAGPRPPADASLKIDGVSYELDEDPKKEPAVSVRPVPTQPGDPGVEFERRLINLARGWGESKWVGSGGYDYGDSAVLHRRLAWMPGSTVTTRTNATVPIGPVSFCEYWDGVAANRTLIIVTPRHIYEVVPAGTVTVNDLGSGFTLANGCLKGENFRTGAMSAPKVFFSRAGSTATDYMVRRTAANTYAVGTANTKFAMAIAKGKDSAGADVLWRVNESGKLNQSLADNDPNADASWSAATYPNSFYPLGDTSTRVNDLVQQNRSMVAGKPDGAWTFDNVLNTIPVTPGMEQTPADRQFMWFKDANGKAIVPTAQGIIWIDGLSWNTCGPISSNQEARQLRGTEVAVSDQAGNFIYAAVYSGSTSYIFLGTPRVQGDTGSGLFTWHGPVASIAKKATDLRVSTVFGTKLWIGFTDDGGTVGGWATIDLNADFSPVTDLAAGNIYLPEGCLDMSGPGVIKDLRKAEFVAPADKPFSATNSWRVAVDLTGTGSYTAIDGSYVTSGVQTNRYWSTERSAPRPRIRLDWTGNTGAAELEAVIVRGTERPETTDEYVFRIRCRAGSRLPTGVRTQRAALTDVAALRAAMDAGRKTTVVYGGTEFSARVVEVGQSARRPGLRLAPQWITELRLRRVKVS